MSTTQLPLTDRQRAIYKFLKRRILKRHNPPTVREIARHFNIKSPNGVMCHLRALEAKGWIRREPQLSRSIELVGIATGFQLRLAGQISAGGPLLACEDWEFVDFSFLFAPENKAYLVTRDIEQRHLNQGDYVVKNADGKELGVIRRY